MTKVCYYRSMSIENKARGIVIHDNKLLVFKLTEEATYYSLPGGHIEFGDTIENAISREMLEETGIPAKVGKLLFIRQLILPDKHMIEFFYFIENGEDYLNIDLSKASHGHEVVDYKFVDLDDTSIEIRPNFLKAELKEILKTIPDTWQPKSITSYS
ncbi:MAG: NUDIX domain-containing protein [Candidatus Azambacteria bacterium]|nr:NUDIX domain-containing protein [Candidatus Azambacteria bacterium]